MTTLHCQENLDDCARLFSVSVLRISQSHVKRSNELVIVTGELGPIEVVRFSRAVAERRLSNYSDSTATQTAQG